MLDCHVFIGHTDVPAEKRLCCFLVQHKLEYIALNQVLKLIQINHRLLWIDILSSDADILFVNEIIHISPLPVFQIKQQHGNGTAQKQYRNNACYCF